MAYKFVFNPFTIALDITVDVTSIPTIAFTTIATPAGTNPVADSTSDTLNLTSTDNSITITGTAGTDTVNFALATPTFIDSTFRIKDNADNTKLLAFEVSGVATGTTRTWTVPDANLNFSTTTSGTFATTTLNNLGTTAINASLMANLASPATNWNVKTADVTASSSQSNGMIVQSGHKLTSGSGITGNLIVRSGEARDATTGATGTLIVQSGAIINASSTSATGTATFRSGDTAGTGIPGAVTVRGGNTAGTLGGGLFLRSGNATAAGGISGPVSLSSGDASTSAIVGISSGTSTTVGNKSGDIVLNTGAVTGAERGLVIVNATALVTTSGGGSEGKVKTADQVTTDVDSEPLVVQSGHQEGGSIADTGYAIFRSGEIRDTSDGNTGFARFESGGVDNALSSGSSGEVQYGSGDVAGSGDSGHTYIEAGSVTTGTRGSIFIDGATIELFGDQLSFDPTLATDYFTGGATGVVGVTGNLTNNYIRYGSTDALTNVVTGKVVLATGANEVASSTAATGQLFVSSGDITNGSGTTGTVSLSSGINDGTGMSGEAIVETGSASGNDSGDVEIRTGASTTSDSGNINLTTGTAGGTRGDITFVDGSEGTSGHVWTSTNTGGAGAWTALSAANLTLSNLSSPTSINQDLLPDTSGARTLGSTSKRWGTLTLDTASLIQFHTGSAFRGFTIRNDRTTPSGGSAEGAIEGIALQDIGFYSGDDANANATATGTVYLESGNKTAGTGNSGNINIRVGTSSGGTRGAIKLVNGSEGTTGNVWTSTSTGGEGTWASTSTQNWTKYTKTFSNLSDTDTANDIELFSLPAKGVIHEVVIKHTTAFSGGTISAYTISVGIVGNLTKYASAFDVFQATSNTVFQISTSNNMENFGAATSIRIAAVSTGDNLNNAAAGSVDVYVRTSTLP